MSNSNVVGDLSHELSRDAPHPLHDQIAALIRQRVVSGRWPAHMRLPSEPELAQMLEVARGTVRRSMRSLIEEGLLVQHQGRGTFVGSPILEQSFAQEIISTAEALDRDGVRYVTTDNVAGHLHLAYKDGLVVALRRVRSVDGLAVYVLDNYVVASRCPGLEVADLTKRPLFDVLEQDYGLVVDGVQRTFQAQIATAAIAELLQVGVGTPVLYLEQISYDKDAGPIEYSDVWIRGDKLRLSAWLRR
jgi:GntR family transcriptional regulator